MPNPPDNSLGNENKNGLLFALNAAAAQIQRSARSETEVFHAFHAQIVGLGLSGSINILSEDGKNLRLVIAAIPWEKVSRLEQLDGASYDVLLDANVTTYQFNIPVASVSLYQHVLDTGESFFEANNSEYISQIVPAEFSFLVDAIVGTFGGQPSICAPLVMDGKIQGLMTVNGVHLSVEDIPTVEAFANHTAIALENARLFAAMEAREVEQNKVESALRASEQKYREVIRQSTDGIILVDEEGLIIEWNDGMERITGIDQSQALRYPIWDIQLRLLPNPDMAQGMIQKIMSQTQDILKTGDSPMMGKPHEYEILHADGNSRYIQLILYTLKTEHSYRICSIVRDITEQRELEKDRLRRTEELAVLQSLSLDLTSVHDLPILLKSIVERAVQLLGAEGGGIYLCEPELEQVRLYAEIRGAPEELIGMVLKYGEGAAGLVVATGKPLIIDDYRIWPGRSPIFESSQPYTAVLSVPMIWQGQVTGVLQVLDDFKNRRFNEDDTELLMLFANHAAVALETTRLLEAERRQRWEAETLVKASSALTSTLDLEQVLDTILDYLEKVVPYDSASIFLLKGEQLHIVAGRGFQKENLALGGFYPVQQDGLFKQMQTTASSLILHDAQSDPRFHGYGDLSNIHGWLGVPLVVRSQVIGCLTLDSQQVGIYNAAHISLAEAFANQAAAAIEHARLFESERLARQRADAVREAAAVVSSSLSLDEVLNAVLDQLAGVLSFDSGNIMFIEGNRAVIKVWHGYKFLDTGKLVESISFNLSPDTAIGTVVSTGEALSMKDVKLDSRWQITELSQDIQSWLGVPLIVRGKVIGLFNLDRISPEGFSEDDVALAQTFAAHAVAAIENARLFEQAALERRYLSLLYDVGRSLASSVDTTEIFNRAVSLTSKALGGLVGQALMYLPDTGQLRLCALYGREDIDLQEINEKLDLRLGIGLSGWVAENRQPVYVVDVTQDERWLHVDNLDKGVHSVISAPILYGDRLFGTLSVLHHERDAFSIDHLDLLQAICREVALSLSNADRYQQVDRRLSEITIIQNLSQIFTQRLDLRVLLDDVVGQLYEKFHYPLVEIFFLSGNRLTLQAFRGNSPKILDQKISEGIIGRVARTGEISFIPDVSQDPEYYACSADTVAELAVPIRRDEKVIGVINIESHLKDYLTEHDRDLLQMLAGQISIAIENAVLYERVRSHAEELERTVEQRTGELTSVYELSQRIGYTLSYEDLMRLVLTSLRKAVGCEITAGCLILSGYRLFLIDSERNISTEAIEQIRSICSDHLGDHLEGKSGIDSIPVEVIHDQEFQSFYPEIYLVNSTFVTLILVGRKVVGVLVVGTEKERVLGRSQMRLLETFAHQTANSIERITVILAAEQKRLEGLVEHLPVGVLLLDSDYRVLVSNPLGKQVLDVLGVQVKDGYLAGLEGNPMGDLIQRYHGPLPYEFVYPGPPRRVFEGQVRPMEQDFHQWVVTLRDVTQERENQARIQMQDRLATVGQLAAGIAHDFNNIMAAILVYADLLMSDPSLPATSRERLSIIEQQVQRAASLIRQILDFSRRAVMEQSSLDLLPFIKELERMLGRVMPETIRLELAYKPGTYTVNADPTRLQQVFMNLAVNARDAMPQGGVLHFSVDRYLQIVGEIPPVLDLPSGDWIKITIRDTGSGIPPEVLPHIFEPFYTTKPVGQGTGLGLAQVYGIIKQHGGFIDVNSQQGQGTEFSIYLPALPELKFERKLTEPLAMLDGSGKAVLVVEDDQATLAALRALLESKNYDVITARNGYEALQQFEQSTDLISLVVSDVVMPQMDGLELYRALQDIAPDMKILFITGHPLEGESQALLEHGDVHWLQKPFSAREFTRVVQNLLEV